MPNKKLDDFRVGPEADRRRKLTPEDRQRIALLHEQGYGIRELARLFCVSRRTIQFICYPERLEQNKQRRKERGGWQQYYDKDEHAKATKEHREYKRTLMKTDCESDTKNPLDKPT